MIRSIVGGYEEDKVVVAKRKAENTPASEVLFPPSNTADADVQGPEAKRARKQEQFENNMAMWVAGSTTPIVVSDDDNFARMIKGLDSKVSMSSFKFIV